MFETITMTDIRRILFVIGFVFIFSGLKDMYEIYKEFRKTKKYKNLQEKKQRNKK